MLTIVFAQEKLHSLFAQLYAMHMIYAYYSHLNKQIGNPIIIGYKFKCCLTYFFCLSHMF